MTTQEVLNILDVIERKYRMEGYMNEAGRYEYEGKLAAIGDVRYYVKQADGINRNGMF